MSVRFSTVDDALGDHAARYFGEGHRRSRTTFLPDGATAGAVRGTGRVQQDGTWSTKGATPAPRHLSTVDAVVLAGLAAEHALTCEGTEPERFVMSGARVRAGTTAHEDLDRVPVRASAVGTTHPGARRFDARVGPLRVAVDLREAPSADPVPEGDRQAPSFLSAHLSRRVQHLDDLVVDTAAGVLSARIGTLTADAPGTHPYRGLQAVHHALLSVPEAIVCLAQLAQAVAYTWDGLAREDSSNFWLRALTVELREPYLAVGRFSRLDVRVDRARVVPLAGVRWRTLRMSLDSPHLAATADVAHALPPGTVAA